MNQPWAPKLTVGLMLNFPPGTETRMVTPSANDAFPPDAAVRLGCREGLEWRGSVEQVGF
jgi:hypothetical protein